MTTNKAKCIDAIKNIKSILEKKYDVLLVNDNILCKVYSGQSKDVSSLSVKSVSSARCPIHQNSIINWNRCTCSHQSTCPTTCNDSQCPLHNQNSPTIPSEPGGDSSNTNSTYGEGKCIFRIMSTDIHNGIALHAIMLYGEISELKMSFSYEDEGIQQVVDTIDFLVK